MSILSDPTSGNSTGVNDLMNKLRLDLREKNLDSSGEKIQDIKLAHNLTCR